ncbi:hypothetical protein F5884DRAFT_855625 [Xylogone sp. PMI_703]|nr:hypothetical protein F5884DRAFT_855625 [Xylogone sp. PMI_703]
MSINNQYALFLDDGEEFDEDYEPPRLTDPSFDEFDQQLFGYGSSDICNSHIRDTFINSALDKTLACSIFGVISSSKPAGSIPLEEMSIDVTGGNRFGDGTSTMMSVEMLC